MFQNYIPFTSYAIIAITVLISISGFYQRKVIDDLIFYPPAIQRGQWYRFFSNGLIHADTFHLIFNMYALFGFGKIVEYVFQRNVFPGYGNWMFLLMYVAALPICLLPTYFRHRHDYHYRSLGASGAVSAVIFAGIVLYPSQKIGIIFIPGQGLPGFIFGPLYLLISSFLDKRGGGNINHSAHIWGALFGIVFILAAGTIAGADIVGNFTFQIRQALRP